MRFHAVPLLTSVAILAQPAFAQSPPSAGASASAAGAGASVSMGGTGAAAGAAELAGDDDAEIVVTGRAATYTNSAVTEAMFSQQTPITSPLALVDNLPGVNVQEGDTFGFDDWSTAVSVRGFQTNLSTQEIGITIDGLPNGGSNYGGGSKANRFVDTMNLGGVQVSQGTADIGSLSNDALGGTIDFLTADPVDERRVRFSGSAGQFDALRAYVRYDTGDLGGVKAWISASHQEATDHVTETAQNRRDHVAAKFTTDGIVRLTGYASYDETHEDNYDQVYSPEQFAQNPDSDGLTGEWVGIPFIDQVYRRAWSTLRENVFTYLRANAEPADGITLNGAVYYHHMKGRGDWVPPYIVDVTDDGAGNPQSEIVGNGTVEGGPFLGQIFFVDASGRALSPIAGCTSSLTFPYGGTSDPRYDPACYAPGAIGAQSYRHTHYAKDRYGVTTDASWEARFGAVENVLRAGIWYEDGERREHRDWHQLIDSRVGPDFEDRPYWVQYRREFPQSTFKWFVQEQAAIGPVTVTVGAKQFFNDIERIDLQGGQNAALDTESDVLLSGGIQFQATPALNLFAGYAENFKSIGDEILENPNADFSQLQPETAENWEVGARFNNGRFQASATYFNSRFENRIIFIAPGSSTGPDYLSGESGSYFNAGGIDSEGFELLAAARLGRNLSLFGSYTHIDAKFRGTGDPLVDELVGIVPGNRVTGIPRTMFVLSADYSDDLIRAGISGKYTGERAVDVANSFIADDYVTVDAYFGVRGEAISASLRAVDLSIVVNNLLDEDYLGGISGGAAWIGAPRTVVATATIDF